MIKVKKAYLAIFVVLTFSALIFLSLSGVNTNPWGVVFQRTKSVLSRTNSQTELLSQNTSQANKQGLLFAVISDIHVRSTDERAQAKFQNALEDLLDPQKFPLDLLVINGDLGDGIPSDYSTLNRIIRNVRSGPVQETPLLFTIGNHEFYKAYHKAANGAWSPETFPNGETDAKALQRFLNFTGRDTVYTDRFVKGYHFIFLGSEKSAMTDRKIGDGAYLSKEQLTWLKKKLAENSEPEKPIFVFLHQPVYTASSDTPIHTQYVVQHEELAALLEAYPQVVLFTGHLHLKLGAPGTVVHETFTLFGDSSVSRVRQAPPEASEGLMVEVQGSKVLVQGRDFQKHEMIPDISYPLDFGR